MDMLFYEYRIMASSRNGPWLLGWRERRDWLDEKLLEKESKESFKKWKAVEGKLDEFAVRTAGEGYVLKKWAGTYEIWRVVKPDLDGVQFKSDGFKRGRIDFQRMPPIISKELEQLREDLKQQYNVEIDFPKDDHLAVVWNASSIPPKMRPEIASKIVTKFLRWYQEKQTNQ